MFIATESLFEYHSLTPDRWGDLEALFGERGACGGCWCNPIEPRAGAMPDAFAWTGLASAFRQTGFTECARRSPTRPIMRLEVR